jgi:hypothetical protein
MTTFWLQIAYLGHLAATGTGAAAFFPAHPKRFYFEVVDRSSRHDIRRAYRC